VAATGVTTLDWDHVEVLGATLPAIATQKAGIFKRGVPAFAAPQRADAMAQLRAVAALVGAPLEEVARCW
jgi:folylpolyglutamate synthase